ncbi:ATP-binding cassette domain-containing protein [Oenococcus kitaharae]|uniref:ECF transporter ATPase component n=1 Tax=Oenococcus kitaharae DSM 17330 TaxID=1045004 RepID=G9WFK3_9LACO|nr:ATP-binding cassette domain-containing protein [Oenococcus kitaharae]EHN59160.1 ECF transporter ATPase component [Oenococcus kitaharae DSM 17330]OEY82028.1 cobalt ABC transporter [Oenococcus kitaharae]OEY82399.1 cobalt ABC transporter [Oenococcus kitaharae]OEY82805.1 cobalt ABC transporter [Oenococcus kitaharae]
MASAIAINDLSFTFEDGLPLFHNLVLTVEKGEWLSIVGRNGSGKTTLMRLILGLETASAGTVEINGRLGAVFQNPEDQFIGATVEDELAFGLENQELSPDLMPEKIDRVLNEVGMSGYGKSLPDQLSGGQKQRIAIGSALIIDADILIFDEATSMLDPVGRKSILHLLSDLHRHDPNLTIINITHDADEIISSQRILVLEDGKIIADRPTIELMTDRPFLKEHHLAETFASKLADRLNKNRPSQTQIPRNVISNDQLISWLLNFNK